MVSSYVPRLLTPPDGSFFLFGPRGTGKSTWLRHTFPSATNINLLDEALYQSLLGDPGLFAGMLRPLESGTDVIIDGVQRIPALLNEVHRHIEERRLRFTLCASSARKLRRGGVNLLAGRAVQKSLHGFLPEELGDGFDLDETLRWGSLPIVWAARSRRETLEAYVQTYLKEEIQAEALVRNLAGFVRFLPVASLFHGQVLNVAGLARDAGVARTTVLGYLDIAEDTLLAYRLPAYEAKLRVRERKHPKFYWVDPGIPRALKKQYGKPAREELGALFEGWLAGILRAYRDYRDAFDDWFYWSPSASNVEVDFLLRKSGELVAVEAKAAQKFSDGALRGLRAISDIRGIRRRMLVYRGPHRLLTNDGIEVLPWREFIDIIEQGELFDAGRPTRKGHMRP